ncbi:uncharacterized protein DUF4913 [Couchioplanes caeruleus]|nr:uncharacterized protein DUF4913 [Couchioplanes caeruleus]
MRKIATGQTTKTQPDDTSSWLPSEPAKSKWRRDTHWHRCTTTAAASTPVATTSSMSIWWRDHLDPHFTVLTGEYGPFGRCSPDRGHVDTAPLPVEPAPADVLAQLPDFELRGS